MANYEKMYYTLFNALENAIEILIKAQQDCEEIYVHSDNLLNLEIINENNKTNH